MEGKVRLRWKGRREKEDEYPRGKKVIHYTIMGIEQVLVWWI